ncbi:MAG TPA: acyl carrier protein [Opitutaceae bacterium]|jgi:acyl carrier protein
MRRTPASETPPDTESASALLRHFPADVVAAFDRFRETGEPAAAEIVVFAVIRDHMVDRAAAANAQFARPQVLIDDLGFDSMAISEMVFFFEDLFLVTIANEEILRVRTVGDLCDFVRAKHAARASAR